MKYKIFFTKSSFKIIEDKSKAIILELIYIELPYRNDGKFIYKDANYKIKSANMWGTKFDLYKSENDIGDISYNWKGEIIIRLENAFQFTKHFILKASDYSGTKYELRDFLTNKIFKIDLIATLDVDHYDYHFEIEELVVEEDENEIDEMLLLTFATYAISLYILDGKTSQQ